MPTVAVHHQSDLRRHRGAVVLGTGAPAGAVAAHHQSRLSESVHLAEQHRLPETAERGDRDRGRPHPLQRVPRRPQLRSQPVFRSGDRLQRQPVARAAESRLHTDHLLHQHRTPRSDATVHQPDAPIQAPLPGRRHLHADVRHARRRRSGISSPGANNQFDLLEGEYATSSDFQRHTVRAWTIYQMPWGLSTSVSYFYGSGSRYIGDALRRHPTASRAAIG